nr:hypothetical protein [uncultured Tolumonas sp.]
MSKEVMITPVTELQVLQQVERAKGVIDLHGTMFPDDTFEDGVIAALTWIFGDAAEPLSHDLGGE